MPGHDTEKIRVAGENRFHTLCVWADLECSKPEPDRTGKDYLVEWPMRSNPQASSYDLAPVRRACRVQVKSTMAPGKSISLKLSAAEWLANSHEPAIVCAPVIDKDSTVKSIVMFGVRDRVLGEILKRLRKATQKEKSLSEMEVRFRLEDGEAIQPTPDALRNWMEMHIGNDMSAYQSAKAKERDTLGFPDDGGQTMTMKLEATDLDSLIDTFMGRGPLPITEFEAWRERFGISLPDPDFQAEGNVEIHVEPTSTDDLTLRIESQLGDVVELTGPAFASAIPGLEAKHQEAEIRISGISFRLKSSKFSYHIDFKCLLDEPQEITHVFDVVKAVQMLNEDMTQLDVKSRRKGLLFTSPITSAQQSKLAIDSIAGLRRTCEQILAIWQAVGFDPKPIRLSRVDQNQISKAASLVSPDKWPKSEAFRMPLSSFENTLSDSGAAERLLYTDPVRIDEDCFAIAGLYRTDVRRREDEVEIHLLDGNFQMAQRLPKLELTPAYQQFVTRASSITNTRLRAVRPTSSKSEIILEYVAA